FRGDKGTKVGAAVTVTAFDEETKIITISAPISEPLQAKRGDYVEIHARVLPAAATTLIVNAKSKGQWGDQVRVRVRPMPGSTYNIIADPNISGNNAVSTTVVSTTNTAGPPPKTTVKVNNVT